MKKVVKSLCLVLSIIFLFFALCFAFNNNFNNEICIVYYKIKYSRTNNIVDSENLSYYIFLSSKQDKDYSYVKELIESEKVNENISLSKLEKEYVNKESYSANDWLICTYFIDLMINKNYELYINEFQMYFTCLDESTQLEYPSFIRAAYNYDKDINCFLKSITALNNLSNSSQDYKIKTNCSIMAQAMSDSLEDQNMQ